MSNSPDRTNRSYANSRDQAVTFGAEVKSPGRELKLGAGDSHQRCRSRTSVKVLSFCALLSHPGLKVRMFFSNIPWKRAMA